MTEIAVASTALTDAAAGEALATSLKEQLTGGNPDAVVVFASPSNDFGALLSALQSGCTSKAMIGCSSAGEFTTMTAGTGMTTAIALRAPDMQFNACIARDLSTRESSAAAHDLTRGFRGLDSSEYRYRTALILLDALAGRAEDLVDQLTLATGGMYQFAGGGAGDDDRFGKTHVFLGTEVSANAVVALEILSNKPIGIGARHGWVASGDPLRVTETNQGCMISLNVAPAVEAFEEHALATSQSFDRDNPMPFFLHNIVGVKTEDGHKLRVPLGINASGGVMTAAEVPAGATAHIMSTQAASAADAAAGATRDAMDQVERDGHVVKGALFFDCVATRLRLGKEFGVELDAVARELGDARFAGFNSYGQIVRAEGQFSGFHNCTAVVCVFPE